jgi:hypothetical protein
VNVHRRSHPSFRRKPESIFASARDREESGIKMDPGFRRDDGRKDFVVRA